MNGITAAVEEAANGDFEVTFAGQPVLDRGTVLYGLGLFTENLDFGRQLTLVFTGGEPVGNVVIDNAKGEQKQVDGKPVADASGVHGIFPGSALDGLGEHGIDKWSAGLLQDGVELATCRDDDVFLPYPG